MNDIGRFKEILERQLAIEKGSVEKYSKFIELFDKEKSSKVQKIIEDEKNHVEIVESMIDIVDRYEGDFETEKEEWSISEDDVYSTMMLVSSLEDYMYNIIGLLENFHDKRDIYYVSYNKIPSRIKKEIKEDSDCDVEEIIFIPCSSQGKGFVDPNSLTDISLRIKEVIEEDDVMVIVDNITSFGSNHPEDSIRNFVSSLNDAVRVSENEIIWVAVRNEKNKDFIDALTGLCDGKIEL